MEQYWMEGKALFLYSRFYLPGARLPSIKIRGQGLWRQQAYSPRRPRRRMPNIMGHVLLPLMYLQSQLQREELTTEVLPPISWEEEKLHRASIACTGPCQSTLKNLLQVFSIYGVFFEDSYTSSIQNGIQSVHLILRKKRYHLFKVTMYRKGVFCIC